MFITTTETIIKGNFAELARKMLKSLFIGHYRWEINNESFHNSFSEGIWFCLSQHNDSHLLKTHIFNKSLHLLINEQDLPEIKPNHQGGRYRREDYTK